MKFIEEIERNFSKIKNKYILNRESNEKIIIKHAVYYEGIHQIKLEYLDEDSQMRIKIIEENQFSKFIGCLKLIK